MPDKERYETLAGETITYPAPEPKLRKFLARITAAAGDPKIALIDLDALIHGRERRFRHCVISSSGSPKGN